MPRIRYKKCRFSDEIGLIIERANEILEDYAAQGYRLTLRQLYYRFVSNNWLANEDRNYDRLGDIMTRARVAGLIDWEHLQDRNRTLRRNSHWDNPADIIQGCVNSYGIDLWEDQKVRVEVFCEKDALVDVLGTACEPWDVSYMACKGYSSTTMLWEAAHNRYLHWKNEYNQDTVLLYLGDHDPSGIQMCEDIERRLNLFSAPYEDLKAPDIEVRRVALNLDQIYEHNPPPQVAKKTDSRWRKYVDRFGIEESWELDALEPAVIVDLIDAEIRDIVIKSRWDGLKKLQEKQREQLQHISDHWEEIVENMEG